MERNSIGMLITPDYRRQLFFSLFGGCSHLKPIDHHLWDWLLLQPSDDCECCVCNAGMRGKLLQWIRIGEKDNKWTSREELETVAVVGSFYSLSLTHADLQTDNSQRRGTDTLWKLCCRERKWRREKWFQHEKWSPKDHRHFRVWINPMCRFRRRRSQRREREGDSLERSLVSLCCSRREGVKVLKLKAICESSRQLQKETQIVLHLLQSVLLALSIKKETPTHSTFTNIQFKQAISLSNDHFSPLIGRQSRENDDAFWMTPFTRTD